MSWPDQSSSPGSVGSAGSAFSSYSEYPASNSSNYTVATQYTRYAEDDQYNMYQPPADGTYPLPCEFVGIGSCDVHFQFEEVEAWVEHIITDHLQGKLPQRVDCWFCTDFFFDAKDPRVPHSDRRVNFYNRMYHIRDHIGDDKTALDMVPDFHLLDHLLKHRLISEGRFNEVRRYHGLPCPREHLKGIYKPNFVPPERRKQAERSNMVQVNQSKEERQWKKDKKKKSSS